MAMKGIDAPYKELQQMAGKRGCLQKESTGRPLSRGKTPGRKAQESSPVATVLRKGQRTGRELSMKKAKGLQSGRGDVCC